MTDSEGNAQLERENSKLKAINALQRQILAMRKEEDMQAVLMALHDHIDHLIEFDGCSISVVDAESGVIRFYTLSAQDVQYQSEVPLSDISPVRMCESQKTFYRKDLDQDDPGSRARIIRKGAGVHVRSVLTVPFSKGTIAINSVHADAFSDEDIALLEELAQVVSECFARVEEVRELERQQERKQADEALRRNEKKYRNLVQKVKDVIYTLDFQGNK